jgi:hypothetical protein
LFGFSEPLATDVDNHAGAKGCEAAISSPHLTCTSLLIAEFESNDMNDVANSRADWRSKDQQT